MTQLSGQPHPPEGSFGELPSPLDSAEDLRDAAKWMIAAAGAVGTALIGGGPLVAVGKVHGLGDSVIVGVALVVALIGVGLAIWQISQVLVPPLTTQATLSEPSMRKLKEIIDSAPAEYFGVVASGVDDLLHHRAVAANLGWQAAAETDPGRRAHLEALYRTAQRNAIRADPYVKWLLATAHVWQIRAALRRARWYLLLSVVLVAAGAVAYLSVTGQHEPVYVPVVTPQVTTAPTAHPT